MSLKIRFLSFILFFPLVVPAQNKPDEINFAHLYDPAEEILLRYKLTEVPEYGKMLILGMTIKNESMTPEDYQVTFFPLENYSDTFSDSLLLDDQAVSFGQMGNTYFIGYPLSVSTPLVIVRVNSTYSGLSYYQDVLTGDVQHFLFMDRYKHPVIENFLKEGEYTMLTGTMARIDYYDHTFPAGRPPMTTSRGNVPRSLEVARTFELDSTTTHNFQDQGLYTVTASDGDQTGEAFRVQGVYYPEYVTVEDLAEPLIYFTTREERQRLVQVGNDKKGFDRFWVELTGSQEKAKWIIKNYYEKVSEANQMFTTYKEGWKTDRGMIYIMFGPPDQVLRSERNETWSYLAGNRLPPMIFNFIKLQTRYSDRQYSLIRAKDHANGWQLAAKYWRMARPFEDR